MVRIQHVLCPLDFSAASLRGFDYSIRLGKSCGAHLHLLHVTGPEVPSVFNFDTNAGMIAAPMNDEAERELRELKKVAAGIGVPADGEIRTGEVCAQIQDAVKASEIDLVVIGKHQEHGLERWLTGSTTERLLRQLPVPMLVIAEASPKRAVPPNFTHILVTTDLSDGTQDAIRYALLLGQEARARVTLLHVMPHSTPGIGLPYEKTRAEVAAEIDRLVPQDARESGRFATIIQSGVPHKEILHFIEENRPDLLVMNIHAKGTLERVLLGSTAEHVLRDAFCPVFAIPRSTVATDGAA